MAYQGYVVEIKELRKHENADRLQIATVFGNNVVVGMEVKQGDIMIYFPVDGQLSEGFATVNNLVRLKGENGKPTGGYLDPNKRNIKAIRLRGEKSDGLLTPLSSLSNVVGGEYVRKHIKVGDPIDLVNGVLICEKYIPKSKTPTQQVGSNKNGKKVSLKSKYPLFEEHRDTSQLAYSLSDFHHGDEVTLSLKLHGTSHRISHTVNKETTLFKWILEKLGVNLANNWRYVSGTRRVILEGYDGGYYGSNGFRKQHDDAFEGKLHKGETVYFEIVGYAEKGKPIMGRVNNKKMNDKAFVKQYGDTTTFSYGCEDGESDIYVYRMTMTNEDGDVVEYPTWLAQLRCEQMGVKHVPVLERFTFKNKEDLMDKVQHYESGTDPIGKTHIREGVVVRIENRESFAAYKQKSFDFKILEGIIKDNATEPDMEEAQDLTLEGI